MSASRRRKARPRPTVRRKKTAATRTRAKTNGRRPSARKAAPRKAAPRKPARRKQAAARKPAARKRSRLEGIPPSCADCDARGHARRAAPVIADSFVSLHFPFGSVIVRRGGEPSPLRDRVGPRARREGRRSDERCPSGSCSGDTFGDSRLLSDTVRTATVRASSEVEVLRLDRSISRRSCGRIRDARVGSSFTCDDEARGLLQLYSAFARLPSEASASCPGAASRRSRERAVVVREGSAAGRCTWSRRAGQGVQDARWNAAGCRLPRRANSSARSDLQACRSREGRSRR